MTVLYEQMTVLLTVLEHSRTFKGSPACREEGGGGGGVGEEGARRCFEGVPPHCIGVTVLNDQMTVLLNVLEPLGLDLGGRQRAGGRHPEGRQPPPLSATPPAPPPPGRGTCGRRRAGF